jgi:hypothetical protein
MPNIATNDKRLIEENVFGIFLGDLMPLPILLDICVVPIEAGAIIQRVYAVRHDH